MSLSSNMPNVQQFPTGIALEREDKWWPYKREVSLAVESKGMQGYLHRSIPKPSNAKPAVTVTSPEGLGVDYIESASDMWGEKATNAGAVITDGQFCVIVFASLPRDWDADIRHLLGKTSSEAFIYLQASVQTPERNRPTCTNPNCKKVGYTIQRCWAKGGGAEGKGSNGWRFNKNNEPNWSQTTPGNTVVATANATAAAPPLETYVLSADMTQANRDTSSSMSTSTSHQSAPPTEKPPDSNDHSFLKGWECQELREVNGVKDVHRHNVVLSPLACEAHQSNTLLYTPMRIHYSRTFIDSGATEHRWVNKSDFVEYY
ncbi:hypothetical protein F5877DRAFT_71419 [Lentinula edodes]|nr:hypothetical protein F5877DRAFT_71419 [Lentinula edodes]